MRLNGFLTASTYRIYEWKHVKATLASSVAPHFLPGLFIESVWPVEKITFIFTSHDKTKELHFLSLGRSPFSPELQEGQRRKETF